MYSALALELLGLMFTVIGFYYLLKQPFPLIFGIDSITGEETTNRNRHFREDVFTWKLGIRLSLLGFFLQGVAIWIQIAFP